jgi:hypothetical protein
MKRGRWLRQKRGGGRERLSGFYRRNLRNQSIDA